MRKARPVRGDIIGVGDLGLYLLGTQPIAGPDETPSSRFGCEIVVVGPYAEGGAEPVLTPVVKGTGELLVTSERVIVAVADGEGAMGRITPDECVVLALPWLVVDTISVSTEGRAAKRGNGPVSIMNVGDPGFMIEVRPTEARALPNEPAPDGSVTSGALMSALVAAGGTNRRRYQAEGTEEHRRLGRVLDHHWVVQGSEVAAWLREPPSAGSKPKTATGPRTTIEWSSKGRERSKRRNRRAAVIIVSLMALLTVGGWLTNFLRDKPERNETTGGGPVASTPATQPDVGLQEPAIDGLDRYGEVGEQLNRAASTARKYTYHGIYAVNGDSVPEGIRRSMETWRRPGSLRVDVVDDGNGAIVRTGLVLTADGARSCAEVEGSMACVASQTRPTELLEVFVERLLAAGADQSLRLEATEIGGGPADCYVADGLGTVCVTAMGALLRADLDGLHYEVASADFEVSDQSFVPDASAAGG